ncbi:helix-turn-helix transcriptional regulator [Actinopolymorpha rutila]|uniref:Putative DNA-binding transcriptional regulator YafY n=1 Tax=Actinopolymorpha rutila TaxID=446787 RepID=A0A852ZKN8_9ACTN|nr:WYL domain-containing protein [Actinopolymorpha rutila]NYH92783.1 putative DNA-binding transcriptional regulator YafY [Actinopolymorpha rutila]
MTVMDPSVRLLRLLSLLPSRPWWSGQELADRLSVSPRTLRRDMNRLRELGYPVQATGGQAGGYALGAGGRLPPLLLDDEEAVATTLGLQLTAASAVAGIESAAVAALAKLVQVLPPRLRERVRALQEATVQVPAPPQLPTVDPAVLTLLAMACRRTEGVRFSYTDHGGRVSTRDAAPHQIVRSGGGWYLVAMDRNRQEWRTFRIDRIAGPELTGQRHKLADPPDPPDAAAMVLAATRLAIRRYEARILLDLEYEKAARAFHAQIVEPVPEGRTVLRVAADDLASLAAYAAGLSYDFEVLDPPELRVELHRRALEIATRHAPPSTAR